LADDVRTEGMRMMRSRRRTWVLAAVLAGVAVSWSAAGRAADWPQWRGPDRTDVTSEPSGWPGGWPPRKLWGRNVGVGCTSAIVVGGRLYVMGWQGDRRSRSAGTDTLYCFDAATGKELWRQSYACRYQGRLRTGDTGAYGGPSSTPTFDKQTGYLYTVSTDGDFRCWDAKRAGKPVWAMNFHQSYRIRQRKSVGGGTRDYGHTCSPLIVGDVAIVEVGSEDGTVMGFDKRTGKRRWASRQTGPAGHTAGPVPIRVGAADCIADLLIWGLVVMRIDAGHEGRTVARFDRKTEFACNLASPAVAGSRVLLTSEYNQSNTQLVAITSGGARQVWKSRSHALVCSPVVHKGRLFMVDKSVKCLDLATGRQLWRGGNFGHGSCVVTGDEKLIVWGNGKLVLADAFPAGGQYRELGRIEGLARGTCYPHVAISDGWIVCKDRNGSMVVVSVRSEDRSAVAKTLQTPPGVKPRSASGTPRVGPARPRSVTDKLHDAPAPKLAAAWPGNRDGLVFAWGPAEKDSRVRPRGKAKIAGGAMQLGGGAMLAVGVDEALLAACVKSHQLAVEARITPADLRQGGPARIISFSSDGYHRNFTLAQQDDRLLLRLRTPRTGDNGMRPETTLCRLTAGKTHHVIVSYSPGRLTCYLDGKRILDTRRVGGDFGNWSPQHLLFGDEWSDRRDWAGTLDHVAIHARVIGAAEAAARHGLASAR